MFDFKNDFIKENTDIETSLFGKKIILKNVFFYDGPITLQYLPYGGIQAIFYNVMIINTRDGFIGTKEVEYDGLIYSVSEFSFLFNNLVNQVFPK